MSTHTKATLQAKYEGFRYPPDLYVLLMKAFLDWSLGRQGL